MAGKTSDVDIAALKLESMLQSSPLLSDWLVLMPVAIPFVFASLIVMMRQRVDRHADLATGGFLLMSLCNLALLMRVMEEGVVVMAMGNWLPPFGIAFAVDAVGALFALATSVIGAMVSIYANSALDMRSRRYGFFAFLLLLGSGVSGAFLTGDIFNLYVWFEVLLISSFGLIIFGGERAQLDGAVRYAILNLVATTFFLIATGYIYGLTGTLNLADIARTVPTLADGAPIAAVGALFLLAFAMKAAAFPLQFWLPASYHTPHPVVGAIFAGLLTKVGVYALFRTTSLIFAERPDIVNDALMVAALGTMLVGVLGAIAQNDIRRTMGFLVVSGIGSMLLGIALGTEEALMGAILYAVHSMFVMTALYLMVGMVTAASGETLLSNLRGIYHATPLVAGLFLVLAFAVAGLPPFSGVWPKIVLLKASLAIDAHGAAFVLLLTGLLTSIAMGRVWALAFWRSPQGGDAVINVEPLRRPGYLMAVVVLTAVVVGLGLFPEFAFQVARAGAMGLIDTGPYIDAVLGLNPDLPPLASSASEGAAQ